MRLRSLRASAVVLFSLLAFPSCGPGTAAKAVRPDDPKAADVLGKSSSEACKSVSEEPQLLTLDWDDTLRIDLERTMSKGVAVVHYDCTSFKVLRDCSVSGSYDYAGFSPAKTVAKIVDEDQLRVNLPIGAVSMQSEIKRGATIDLVYLAVGQQATTVHDVPRSKMTGKCEGATHTVRSANVGAFALTTGTKGEVNAAVQVLGRGGSGGSASSRAIERVNGELAACEKASDSATEPTPKCRALVQLLLAPLAGGAPSPAPTTASADHDPAKGPPPAPIKNPCPEGFREDKDGLCTRPEKAAAYTCDVASFDECRAQCDKGSPKSCYNAGANRASPQHNKTKYEKVYGRYDDAFPFMEKACSLGSPEGCGQVGVYTKWGYGTKKDHDKAEAILLKACAAGDAASCKYLAGEYKYGSNGFKKDPAAAYQQSRRGCALGDQDSCVVAASALAEGVGVAKDLDAAVSLLGKACDAGDEVTCKRALNIKGEATSKSTAGEKVTVKDAHTRLGLTAIENPCGQGLRVDANSTCIKPDAGAKYLCDPADFEECKKLCDAGDGRSCLNAAANRVGKWNPDASKSGASDALPFLEKSCAVGHAPGCGEFAYALHWGRGTSQNRDRSLQFFDKACSLGDVPSCKYLGSNRICSNPTCNGIPKDLDKGVENLKKACELGDNDSCVSVAGYLENGTLGVKKDPKAAGTVLDKACKSGLSAVCTRAQKLTGGK